MSALVTRPCRVEEFDELSRCLDSAFGWGALSPARRAGMEADFEWDRSLTVWDGPRIVGTTGAYSLSMGVPGAVVPLAGVTLVCVSPTHRRQGVLTGLMTRQLQDLAEAGDESVAGLWASEAAIYQRFGFGIASWRATASVRAGVPFSPGGLATLARAPRVSLVAVDEALPVARAVVDAVAERVPGALRRRDSRWFRSTLDESAVGSRQWWAVTEGGFARYRLLPAADAWSRQDGTVKLEEIVAATPEAAAALWRFVLDLDLVSTVEAPLLGLSDPLLLLLADPRMAGARVKDGLQLRVISVPRALEERTFSAPLDLVLRVADPVIAANDGCWHVSIDELGACSVSRTDVEPDLSLGIAELSAAHLGSTGLGWLAAAGRVVEHTPGALRSAARAWAWDVPAACLEIF